MNNFIFCSISRIPLRKRYLVFQRHILTAFFQNCVYHDFWGSAVFIWDASLQYDA